MSSIAWLTIGGGFKTEEPARRVFEHVLRRVHDPNAYAVVLSLDCPGGLDFGLFEFAEALYRARELKPIVGYANPTALSAGFLIACACGEFVAAPGATVGSLKAKAVRIDPGKEGVAAVAGAGYELAPGEQRITLPADAQAFAQGLADDMHTIFREAVARYRGRTVEDVARNFGEGATFNARRARERGIVDRIETKEQLVERLVRREKSQRSAVVSHTHVG